MVEPVTAIAAAAETAGLAAKGLNWAKEKLPAHKAKKGYAQLHNGFLMLVADFDRLPLIMQKQLLNKFDRLSNEYERHNLKDLKLFKSLKTFTLLENIEFANKFYHDSKLFNVDVELSSTKAWKKAMREVVDGVRPRIHEISPGMSQQILEINLIPEMFRQLLELRRSLDSRLQGSGSVLENQPVSVIASAVFTGSSRIETAVTTTDSIHDSITAAAGAYTSVHLFQYDATSSIVLMPEGVEWQTEDPSDLWETASMRSSGV
ncbi:hypothetical protein B0H12DRAFT_1101618 [Mycena haematopus]|nr:hypothetical protein B0H12DRAFT_1101618 [Mycena haematopus]